MSVSACGLMISVKPCVILSFVLQHAFFQIATLVYRNPYRTKEKSVVVCIVDQPDH